MAKNVLLSPVAEMNYEDILDYIFENFGFTVSNNFVHRFEKAITFIAENPEMYRYVNKSKKIRRCSLTKHNTIYFENMLITSEYWQSSITARTLKN